MNQLNQTIKPLKKQHGMTMISMAILIVMIGFIGLIGLRLFPVYMENWKMSSHLDAIAEVSTTGSMTNAEVTKALLKRFDIDDIENIKAEHIFIERPEKGKMVIAIEYEVRTPGIGNVEMVVSIAKEVDVN